MIQNEKKLKILLISPLPPPAGGIATWTKLFRNSEVARNNHVDIVNSAIKGQRVNTLEKKRVFDEIKRFHSIYQSLKNKLKSHYDIVHINSACSTFGLIRDYLLLQQAKKSKAKVIVHFHCDTSYMVQGKLGEFVFRKICGKADQIFCLNHASEQHIKEVSSKPVIKIPNFIDLNSIQEKESIISEKVKNVIFVGHVVKTKGCMDIIAIAKKLPKIDFKIIGKESEEFQSLTKPSNIHCLGEISKEAVISHMQKADLLLFPTYTEGFPNVILEAMVNGLPVVTTPVGAIPEMIEDRGGKIIEVGHIEGFIKAIQELQEPTVRKQISEWNKEKVKKAYALEIVMNQIFQEYVSVS